MSLRKPNSIKAKFPSYVKSDVTQKVWKEFHQKLKTIEKKNRFSSNKTNPTYLSQTNQTQ